jgi:hypothetical protein
MIFNRKVPLIHTAKSPVPTVEHETGLLNRATTFGVRGDGAIDDKYFAQSIVPTHLVNVLVAYSMCPKTARSALVHDEANSLAVPPELIPRALFPAYTPAPLSPGSEQYVASMKRFALGT